MAAYTDCHEIKTGMIGCKMQCHDIHTDDGCGRIKDCCKIQLCSRVWHAAENEVHPDGHRQETYTARLYAAQTKPGQQREEHGKKNSVRQ